MLTLYGCKGCGSVVIEVLLKLTGESFQSVRWDFEDDAAWSKLATISAQRQVPTLVLDDSSVMTESTAIISWLFQRFPESPLLPRADPERAQMYRWLAYLSSNVYPAISIGDYPERWIGDHEADKTAMKAGALARLKHFHLLMEAEIAAPSYLLGDSMSALDIYAAMLTHWRPGPAWFKEHCPKLSRAARLTEQHPVVREVFSDHFGALESPA
jgi:GST-like protein